MLDHAAIVSIALQEAIEHEITSETMRELEDFSQKLSLIASELDYQNNMWHENYRGAQRVLNNVSQLVKELFN